jgi:hypothetical protein
MDWDEIESPVELARTMWSELPDVARLSPDRFQSLFDRVFGSTDDLEALWQLGGATNDYLRANPGAISVPVALPRRLLSSEHKDARIVGLKLLNRCGGADNEIVRGIVCALKRRDGYESCGGIFELGNFLDSRYPSGTGLDASLIDEIWMALEPLVDDGMDVHRGASHAMDRLRSLR